MKSDYEGVSFLISIGDVCIRYFNILIELKMELLSCRSVSLILNESHRFGHCLGERHNESVAVPHIWILLQFP